MTDTAPRGHEEQEALLAAASILSEPAPGDAGAESARYLGLAMAVPALLAEVRLLRSVAGIDRPEWCLARACAGGSGGIHRADCLRRPQRLLGSP